MRINLHQHTSSSEKDLDLVYTLLNDMAKWYHIDDESSETLVEYCLNFDFDVSEDSETGVVTFTPARGPQDFVDWLKNQHNITASIFMFGPEEGLLSFGFDIDEDQHLTQYMLKR